MGLQEGMVHGENSPSGRRGGAKNSPVMVAGLEEHSPGAGAVL